MHSTIIALFATTAGFAAATPLAFAKQAECPSTTHNSAYYVCGNNGFRGYCSVDPCAKPWCPDFKLKTCKPFKPVVFTYPNMTAPATNCSTTTTTIVQSGTTTTTVQTGTTTTTFCSSTTTPTACSESTSSTSTTCSGTTSTTSSTCLGTTSTTSTACSSTPTPPVCPGTAGCPKPPVVEKETCTGPGAFYVCGNNGFRGNCSVDPCALAWCPDYESKTCKAACGCGAKETKAEAVKNESAGAERRQDNGVCPQGTGYYQVCGNGFRGCCKADACGQASPICPQSSW